MKVVRFGSSLSLAAPVYVQADRSPPRMSKIVSFTSPLYGISTDFPSLALQKEHVKASSATLMICDEPIKVSKLQPQPTNSEIQFIKGRVEFTLVLSYLRFLHTPYRDDVTSQAMSSISTLQHSRKLRVSYTSLLPGGAH
ncbi:hypothetical protein E2C01_050560 [Portunus trituberculatus]|uniref:Uncharacterized protein n=1 Tax=Portunus trituberculatus TaxID=210409 RepID=A0A5B7GHC7_PORTR|nr:hypothetical protein [Portunus trituberculatus]